MFFVKSQYCAIWYACNIKKKMKVELFKYTEKRYRNS